MDIKIDDLIDMYAMFERLDCEGGKIVSSTSCDSLDIAEAQMEGRMFTTEGGLGFIWMREEE